MKQWIIKWLSNRFVPIRNVQNGDSIKLIMPKRYNGLSGTIEEDAYNGTTGIVEGVKPGVNNSFVLRLESGASLVCVPNKRGGKPRNGMVYEMDGKIYRCEKARE